MEGTWSFIPTVPFRMVPDAAIHKLRQPEKYAQSGTPPFLDNTSTEERWEMATIWCCQLHRMQSPLYHVPRYGVVVHRTVVPGTAHARGSGGGHRIYHRMDKQGLSSLVVPHGAL